MLSYDPIMRTISLSRILLLTAIFFPNTRGYILGQDCPAHSDDIEVALDDFSYSSISAWSSLTPQNDAVEDWFGLLEPLFSGLSYSTPYAMQQWMLDPNYDVGPETISLTETFQNQLNLVNRFDETEHRNLQEALDADLDWDESLPANLQRIDSTVRFECDPTTFSKVDSMNDASPFWVGLDGVVLQITTDPVLCPTGLKTRIAEHPATTNPTTPAYFVVILCPEILTQTPGRPKMWATLFGEELTDTRPANDTQDHLLWLGMPIDSLRQNVLSVWIGRIVLLVMGVKYSDRIHISTAPTLRTFEQCKGLHWSGGLSNLDSLSLYITGSSCLDNLLRNGLG